MDINLTLMNVIPPVGNIGLSTGLILKVIPAVVNDVFWSLDNGCGLNLEALELGNEMITTSLIVDVLNKYIVDELDIDKRNQRVSFIVYLGVCCRTVFTRVFKTLVQHNLTTNAVYISSVSIIPGSPGDLDILIKQNTLKGN